MIPFLLVVLLPALLAGQYPGTDIRGSIVTHNPYYNIQVPLQYAEVDLYSFNPLTNQWILLAKTATNAHGFYFFHKLPVGNYFIQVNRMKNYEIMVVMIDYTRFQFQDMPIFFF
ncbi:MAG: hypothetical protein ABIA75_13795 [Candidatus Neomarinimicrobiota bacterium]